MTPQPTAPPPLRGPLRLRDVLFSRRTAPLTAHRPQSKLSRIVFWAAGGLMALLLWHIMRLIHSNDALEFLWAIALMAFLIGELGGSVLGASLTQSKFHTSAKQGQLAEIMITSLRPVEIGQLTIASALGNLPRFLWLLWGAFSISLLIHHPDHVMFIITMGAMTLNAIISMQEQSWVGLAVNAGLGKGMRTFMALSHLTFIQLLSQVPLLMLFVLMTTTAVTIAGTLGHPDDEFFNLYFHSAVLILAGPHWLLKWLFARAHAARLERVVFPNLEL